MNSIHSTAFTAGKGFLLALLLWSTGCQKEDKPHKGLHHYRQVNLVANDDEYAKPVHEDKNLLNAWGLVFSPNGLAWIAAQEGHVSTIFNSEGGTVLPPVHIPSPGNLDGDGNPTGIVFNPEVADFIIPSGNTTDPTGARFIFAGVDGVISAWNGTWGEHAYRKFVTTGVYTGLAFAKRGDANLLYGANFKTGKIDVWDKDWNTVSGMAFTDPDLPGGYAPFNVQAIGEKLY
ncbi:MAG TPA: TIGR03118 family protein, partial [Niastella sp.]|nr:TIGR03118 family protein [Niastella sp.]